MNYELVTEVFIDQPLLPPGLLKTFTQYIKRRRKQVRFQTSFCFCNYFTDHLDLFVFLSTLQTYFVVMLFHRFLLQQSPATYSRLRLQFLSILCSLLLSSITKMFNKRNTGFQVVRVNTLILYNNHFKISKRVKIILSLNETGIKVFTK